MISVPILIDHDMERSVIWEIHLSEEWLEMIKDKIDKFIVFWCWYRKYVLSDELLEISLLTKETEELNKNFKERFDEWFECALADKNFDW